ELLLPGLRQPGPRHRPGRRLRRVGLRRLRPGPETDRHATAGPLRRLRQRRAVPAEGFSAPAGDRDAGDGERGVLRPPGAVPAVLGLGRALGPGGVRLAVVLGRARRAGLLPLRCPTPRAAAAAAGGAVRAGRRRALPPGAAAPAGTG